MNLLLMVVSDSFLIGAGGGATGGSNENKYYKQVYKLFFSQKNKFTQWIQFYDVSFYSK